MRLSWVFTTERRVALELGVTLRVERTLIFEGGVAMSNEGYSADWLACSKCEEREDLEVACTSAAAAYNAIVRAIEARWAREELLRKAIAALREVVFEDSGMHCTQLLRDIIEEAEKAGVK